MTRRELNDLNMLKSVSEFLTSKAGVLTDYVAIFQSKRKVDGYIEEIESLAQLQATDTKTEFKIQANDKGNLNGLIVKVSSAATAYAASTSDLMLRAAANLDITNLKHLREGIYDLRIKAMIVAVRPIVDKLALWNVTAADLDEIESKMTLVSNKIPELHNKKNAKAQATVELRKKLSDSKKYLTDTMDALMLPFQTLNPTLHAQYKSARKLEARVATRKKATEENKTDAKNNG